jgi:hypothetical protein
MRNPIIGTLLVLLLLCPLTAAALDLGIGSRTYLSSREGGDANHFLTFYEYLDSDVGRPGGRGFSFHAGAWGRVDALDESWDKRANGELQYGYLDWVGETANTTASLGRLSISEGVAAAEQVDGLAVRSDLLWGFAAALYGGIPVETDDDGRGGDSVYGGRLSQGISGLYRVGVSYLREKNDGNDYREDLGADLSFSPAGFLDLAGSSSYNVAQSGWMKHDYLLTIRAMDTVSLRGTVTWVDYDLFFYAPDNMAFFNPGLDPGETMLLLGGGLDWEAGGGLVLSVDYKSYSYDIAGSAAAYGAGLTWSGSGLGGGLSGELMRGEEDELRYSQYRAWGTARIGMVDATLDLLDTVYAEEVSGVKNAYEGSAGLGYDVAKALRVAVDVVYAHNPWYDREVRGMFKVLYRFNSTSEGGSR